MPPEGAEWAPFLARKFGGQEQAARVYDHIADTAAADGLDMQFEKIKRRPSTVDAHRVLRFVEPLGGQDRTADALFDFYFRQGADISDRDVLAEAAAAGGLERDVAKKLLEGDAERAEVLEESKSAREAGVSGAPTFVIGGSRVASGALETQLWRQVIDEMAEQGLIAP